MAGHDPHDAADAVDLEQLRLRARRAAAALITVAGAVATISVGLAVAGVLSIWIGAGLTIGAAMQLGCGLWWWRQVGPAPRPSSP